ncbi:MAG: TraR/DksA C4-type zinc finger protein [Betaproteobacteria bacterium]|jgi:DnaK suppressor protein|nr:TraR/DksA C4-type zinc finger protein [Betaproteobacteria bacterium]
MTLSKKELDALKRQIEARCAALQAELHADADKARGETYADLAGGVADEGDESVADLMADIDNAELTRDLAELRALEAALERIADGSYGACIDCGLEIGFERLKVEPGALRCIECQRVHEKTFAHPERPRL